MTSNRDFSVANEQTRWDYPLVFDDGGEMKKIFVNRHLLAGISPVFEKLFFDPNFKDASAAELKMESKVYSEFLEFIESVCEVSCPRRDINVDNFEILLEYAQEYLIESLRRRCKHFIDEMFMKPNSVQDPDHRALLARMILVCSMYDIKISDDTIRTIARFPLPEIKAIRTQSVCDDAFMQKVVDRKNLAYIQVRMHSSAVVKYRMSYDRSGTCCACKTKTTMFACVVDDSFCLEGGDAEEGLPQRYCYACFDIVHARLHKELYCPDCEAEFYLSTDVDADKCDCPF